MLLPTHWDNVEEWILRRTFKALKNQTYPKAKIHYFLLVTDRTVKETFFGISRVLQDYISNFTYIRYEGREGEATRFPEMAEARNILLNYGKKFDFCFFLDSDVVLPKFALRKLVSNHKDICGGIVSIPSSDGDPVYNFGVFSRGFQNGIYFAENIPTEMRQVGFINTACMLISSKVINDKNVRFCSIKYGEDKDGSEDHSYCYLARLYGYEVWVDPSIHCKHYRRKDLTVVELMKT